MANLTHEILTLQIGHYANFVGTHWWNIQDSSFVYAPSETTVVKEINSDILYREGCTLSREVTYTPRLVAIDLKGSLRTLSQEGVLYANQQKHDVKWANDITLHEAAAFERNEFLEDLKAEEDKLVHVEEKCSKEIDTCQASSDISRSIEDTKLGTDKVYDLDDSVEVWSDFLRPHLHPRSIHVCKEYQHDNCVDPFDVFNCGSGIYHTNYTDIEDKLHFFLEECDRLQGFHMLVDTHNAFGGLAASIMQELADDYSTKGIFAFAVSPSTFSQNTGPQVNHRLLNTLLTYDSLATNSSVLLPLSLANDVVATSATSAVEFPHLRYKSALPYHSSAILAASIDTATLPYRLIGGTGCLLSHLTSALTPLGRTVACLHASLPFPINPKQTLSDALHRHGVTWRPLTPMCSTKTAPYAQTVVMRGFSQDSSMSRRLEKCPPGNSATFHEVIDTYWRDQYPSTLSHTTVISQMCKLSTPWPRLFTGDILSDGYLSSSSARQPDTVVPQAPMATSQAPMATSLQCGMDVRLPLIRLCNEARRLDLKQLHRFVAAGLEADDLEESLERVTALAACYT